MAVRRSKSLLLKVSEQESLSREGDITEELRDFIRLTKGQVECFESVHTCKDKRALSGSQCHLNTELLDHNHRLEEMLGETESLQMIKRRTK